MEYLGDAVDEDAHHITAMHDIGSATAANEVEPKSEETFSRSFSYSNVNGKEKERVRVEHCRNGNCETVEQHGNGTPASYHPSINTAKSSVRDTPQGGIYV